MRDQAEAAQVEVEEIRSAALERPDGGALSLQRVAALARRGAGRGLPPAAAVMLQRQVGNRATRRVLARAYGDDALVHAATGKAVDAVEAVKWLQGQSMEALVAILHRAKQRKGVIDQLMAALNQPDVIRTIGAGGKRLEAAVRAAAVAGGQATGAELMKISLLMDEAGLPQDQRDLINGLTKTSSAPRGTDGLDTALAHGDFRTAFAYLNGIDMARMLKRLRGLGDAWLLPMYAQREQAGFLGEASRTRLEIAMVAAQRARSGSANADDVTWLKEQMAKISLPSDQQEEVLKVMPRARPPEETIREYFSQADISPLIIPWAVERTLRLLNGRTPEAIRKILLSLADSSVVLALIRNSKLGDGKYDMEPIRQGIQQAWGEQHPGIEAPWGIVQSDDISKLQASEKLLRAITAAPMSDELTKQVLAQLTPENLAIMGAFTGLYIAAQATPAGWAADIIIAGLTVAGLVMAGEELLAILGELMEFFKVVDAKTPEDINRAAQHFGTAVSKLTIDVVMAILLHKVTKTATGAAESAMRGTAGETGKVYTLEPKSPTAIELPPDALEGRGSRKVVAGETKTAPFGEVLGERYSPQGTSEITVKVGRPPGRMGLEKSLPRVRGRPGRLAPRAPAGQHHRRRERAGDPLRAPGGQPQAASSGHRTLHRRPVRPARARCRGAPQDTRRPAPQHAAAQLDPVRGRAGQGQRGTDEALHRADRDRRRARCAHRRTDRAGQRLGSPGRARLVEGGRGTPNRRRATVSPHARVRTAGQSARRPGP